MLHSLRRHNDEDITVYLMNRSLNNSEIKRFGKYLHKRLGMEFNVLDVSNTFFEQIYTYHERFSIEMYYRVLAQFLLPKTVDRILWLDSDIVLCGDISEFYHQDFEGNLLVACADALWDDEEITQVKNKLGLPKDHIYFNSGVLLLNIGSLREETSIDGIVETTQSIAEQFTYPDQDLLNYLYQGKIKYCDQNRFNCQTKSFKKLTKDQIDNIIILHYAGGQKPWLFYYLHDLSEIAVPYVKEIALQRKWLSLIKLMVLYAAWLVYDKTGVCHIVRKGLSKGK